jgi:long-chain fatty acid transport protein
VRPLPVVLFAVSVALLFPAMARADDAHYQNFLLGERASGMGGAFTAIANDPSGTYYNPAGLVDIKSGLLSANLNFYSFQQQSLANALHVPGGNLIDQFKDTVTAAVDQLNVVPGSAGEAHGIGPRDASGHYHHAWALSVMVPDSTSGNSINEVVDSTGTLRSLSQTTLDLTVLAGLGYAYRYNDQWSFGISGNALYRQVTRNSRSVDAAGYGTSGPSTTYSEDDISLELWVLGLYLQGGVLYRATPKLRLGLTIATPSLTVFSSATSDEVLTSAGGTSNGLTEIYQPGLSGDSRWPVHGRLGAAYEIIRDLTVAADLSLWGIVHYGLVDGASANQRLPNFVNDITREPTFNVDLGVEYEIAHKYPLRAGFFTNLSSAPKIDSGPEPQVEDVNLYGVTAGFTLPGEHTETTFGLTFSFGDGQAKTPITQVNQALAYASGPTSQFFLNLYVGGSYRF